MSNRVQPRRPQDSSDSERLADVRATVSAVLSQLSRDQGAMMRASEWTTADDEHDPEGSTIAFERAQLGAAVEAFTHRLRELDDAAARLRSGEYGFCEQCGHTIAPGRLAARPTARTCITCAAATRR